MFRFFITFLFLLSSSSIFAQTNPTFCINVLHDSSSNANDKYVINYFDNETVTEACAFSVVPPDASLPEKTDVITYKPFNQLTLDKVLYQKFFQKFFSGKNGSIKIGKKEMTLYKNINCKKADQIALQETSQPQRTEKKNYSFNMRFGGITYNFSFKKSPKQEKVDTKDAAWGFFIVNADKIKRGVKKEQCSIDTESVLKAIKDTSINDDIADGDSVNIPGEDTSSSPYEVFDAFYDEYQSDIYNSASVRSCSAKEPTTGLDIINWNKYNFYSVAVGDIKEAAARHIVYPFHGNMEGYSWTGKKKDPCSIDLGASLIKLEEAAAKKADKLNSRHGVKH